MNSTAIQTLALWAVLSPRRLVAGMLALTLAAQLSCAGGGVLVPPDQYPTAASGCRLAGVRVGEKVRLTMKDGRKTAGHFVRADCSGEPTLLMVRNLESTDPWNRPDTQAVAFSAIKGIRLGDSNSAKNGFAIVIGSLGLIAILLLAHAGAGSHQIG